MRALIVLAALALAGLAQAAPLKVKPRSAAEQRVAKTYRAAMKRGRIATKRKRTAAAIKAFGAALAAWPGDAEALAERGFARLRGHDDAAAERDLRAAEAHAVAATLHGQIWFNLGLLAEQRGDAAAARDAFAHSNRVRPTRAALEKLGGVAGCGVTIDRTRVAGTIYPSWQALAIGLDEDSGSSYTGPPDSDAEARALLCGEHRCDGAGPWIVASVEANLNATDHLVVPLPHGRLLVFVGLGSAEGGWCPSVDVETIEGGAPLRVHVSTAAAELAEITDGDGEVQDCDDDGVDCSDACFLTGQADVDDFFDVAAGARVLALTRPARPSKEYAADEADFVQPVALAVTKDGVTLTGGGCDQTIAFTPQSQ